MHRVPYTALSVDKLCLFSRLNCSQILKKSLSHSYARLHCLSCHSFLDKENKRSNCVPRTFFAFNVLTSSFSGSHIISHQTRHCSTSQGSTVIRFLSESKPVLTLQEFLVNFHEISGLPWWGTIVLTSVMLRSAITFPLAVYQSFILAKYENIIKEMTDIIKELNKETAFAIKKFGWTNKQAGVVYRRSVKKQRTKLILRDNCHPFKATVLVLFQIPLWVCYSSALRNMVYMLPPYDISSQQANMELASEGFMWFQNLLIADSTMILPIMFVLANLTVIEISALTKMNQSSKLQKFFTNFFRVMVLVMGYFGTQVPSCIVLYWMTSSVYGLGQNLILLSPRVRRLFRIPHSPSQLTNPYKHIAQGFKAKVERILKTKPISDKP